MDKKVMCSWCLVIGIVLGVAMTSCTADADDGSGHVPSIERYIDEEAGVVCYSFGRAGTYSGAMSCLPIGDTRLEDQDG